MSKAMEKAFEAQAKIRAIINEAENKKISWEEAVEQMKIEITSLSIEEGEDAGEEWSKQYTEENKFQEEEPEGDDLREVEVEDFVKVLHEQYIRWGKIIDKDEYKIVVEFDNEDKPAEFFLWEVINVEKNIL